MNILVVEDDEDIRQGLQAVLECDGYSVETAENGEIALKMLPNIKRPCLILLDMMMPVMNGKEFLEAMLKDAALAPILVIVVSANADSRSVEGAKGFLKKPVDVDTILNVARHHCQTQDSPQ